MAKSKIIEEKTAVPVIEEEDAKIAEVIDKEMSKEAMPKESVHRESEEAERKREERKREVQNREIRLEEWQPKTELGKLVRAGKIKDIDEIFQSGQKILEAEIVDSLLDLKSDLLLVGQAKGKFGGGKRRAWRQTQRKTTEGNVATFSVVAVVGNENGYVGIGIGKAKETLPAKEKAIRKAKLNLIKVIRGCGSYDCSCDEIHSIPMEVEGKCSSVRLILKPAPQGTGLVAGGEIKRILKLAGIKDVYSKSFGQKRTTINFASACLDALDKLNKIKLK
jgi:small subunit ribosomal protein S5